MWKPGIEGHICVMLAQIHYSIYNLLHYEHVEMRCLYTSSFLLQEEVWSVQTTKEEGKDDTVTEELEFCQDRCVWL
jgi:hypothetical protein